jgi:hypothetical protein
MTRSSRAKRLFHGVVEAATRALPAPLQRFVSRVGAPAAAPEPDDVHAIFERARIGIFRATIAGQLVQANPALLRAFGYDSMAQINEVGLTALHVAPDQHARFVEALRAGPVSGFRASFRRADGRVIVGHVSAHLVPGADGEPAFLEGTFEDWTERRAAETAVRESERRLAQIIDFLPDATFVIDRDGKVVLWNHALEEMTGVPASEMIGKGDYEYALPFYGERRPILIDLARRRHESVEGRYANLEKHGAVLTGEAYTPNLRGAGDVFLYATASALIDSEGRVTGAIECIRDITERKQAELELRAAREAAESGNKAKNAFLASMSHELRTPLNAIIGYSEMLAEEAEDEGTASLVSDLKKIQTTGKHLLSVINGILDFSKIESGKLEITLEELDFATLVREAASAAQALVEKKGNRFELTLGEGLGLVRSDPARLRQCLLDLLSNAAKFTERGVVGLSAGRWLREGRERVELKVSDTGIGMTDEQLGKLFQPFVHADDDNTHKYGGAGLGLVIARRFVELMGGTLTVASEPGKGSTFTIVLPVEGPLEPAEGSAARRAQDEPKPLPARRPVLLIDSDDDARLRVEETLAREGFGVVSAATRAEGLRLARTIRPAAIVLDVTAPALDGWALLGALEADEKTGAIPVVILSVTADHDLGRALGAADVLHEPIERERLVEVLARHAQTAGRTVLVVDDDTVTRTLMRRMVEREGFEVVEATNGREALARIEARAPQLVLLDLMMPEMDGFELVATLRRDPRWGSLPVVVVTAKDLTREERQALEGQVTASFQKGKGHAALIAEVRALVAGAGELKPS